MVRLIDFLRANHYVLVTPAANGLFTCQCCGQMAAASSGIKHIEDCVTREGECSPTGLNRGTKARSQRAAYRERFQLTPKQARRLTESMMAQLSQCKSDEQRRLILFASQKEATP